MGPVRMLALAGAAALVDARRRSPRIFPPASCRRLCTLRRAGRDRRLVSARRRRRRQSAVQVVRLPSDQRAFVWPASWRIDQKDIKDTAFIGVGVGYAWNNWLRIDVTGEYRADVKFKALGSFTEFCPAAAAASTSMTAIIPRSSFLANAYLDLGTWWCLTPFVGAGVGGAYHTDHGAHRRRLSSPAWRLGFGYADKDHTNMEFRLGAARRRRPTTSLRTSRSSSPIAT